MHICSFLCISFIKDKDDLKTQIDKLWREVNALKEMQALQSGKAAYAGQWHPKVTTAFPLSHSSVSLIFLRVTWDSDEYGFLDK